ncbi:hexulose-6-phosphate synthase [Planococcus antarcticus DSM 14505]|uniref:3-hexulose-6-phosphate synthase n=1 Tax=Planococcus antarcticus DSM 14505 TaxID=1185653 RepID=A0AA87IID5_9BACL|nr:3-hexulose-6-phosphate synthase [Planococcus antarcticus]EIM05259.1 hexulose-6-phosphate synthase [Planococcus antarcticus DSM 14505]
MNFQLALDRLTRDRCFQLLKETEASIDWIEVGTGVIKEYGMTIVRDIKTAYPEKILVADMKTCDAGQHEAIQAFEAGADITTVMAFSADRTITATLEVAKDYGKRVMVDLLGVTDPSRLIELQNLGVDLISLHYGKDMQLEGEMKENLFTLIDGLEGMEVAIAGGINQHSLAGLLGKRLDTIIIGSAITAADNPGQTANDMKKVVKQYEVDH